MTPAAATQHPNLLTRREMEALTAVCDTLLPSVQLPADEEYDDGLVEFYATSASMAGTPAVVIRLSLINYIGSCMPQFERRLRWLMMI